MAERPSLRTVGGSWLGPALTGVLAILAYRALLQSLFGDDVDVERWLFRPSRLPPLLFVAAASWLLWRRLGRLRALPDGSAPLLAGALAALGTALFAWAQLTRAADLFVPSLAANGLAFAAAARGWAGCRAALLPAIVLLPAVGIPAPLQEEIVWQLQQWTATGAHWLLDTLGMELLRAGVLLRGEEHSFRVIDGCSGLNGIAILTLVAVVVRDLVGVGGVRSWCLVGLAPLIGFALNVVRIATIAASSNPEAMGGAEGDHTVQGLVVLTLGSVALYALGLALARRAEPPGSAPGSASRERSPIPWRVTAVGLAGLVVLTLALPRFGEQPPEVTLDFPIEKGRWQGETVPFDPLFSGPLPYGVHRRYAIENASGTPTDVVELLIGYESTSVPDSSRLLSSKLAIPGPEWDLVRRHRERIWQLGLEGDLALSLRQPEGAHALVYTWRLRDSGFWRESLRSLLALDSSPFRRDGRRAVVRLVTYTPHDGQLIVDRAKQRLDRFIKAFREELGAL